MNTQSHTLKNDRGGSTENTPIKQIKKTDSMCNMSDGRLDCATRSNSAQNMSIKSDQSCTKCDTRTRSGWISHRLERLGIGT